MKGRSLNTFSLLAILLGGFGLRVWGIAWGLPYLFHPDEYQVVQVYLMMVKNHSLSPHFFGYPGFPLYINALFYAIYYLFQRLMGVFQGPGDIAFPQIVNLGTGVIADPNIYLIGRLLSIIFGVGTIFLSYLCAKEISKKPYVGLLAAAFTAFSNANVVQSRLILPNIYVAFFTITAIWASVRLRNTGRMTDYLLAGLAVGLTASSKYNGAVVILSVVVAHFLRTGFKGWKDKKIYFSFLAAGLVFLITNFFIFLDFNLFLEHFRVVSNSYIAGWPGFADLPVLWYTTYLLRMEGIVAIAALVGILWAVWKRQFDLLIPGSFVLVNFGILCLMKFYNEHTLLPLLPAFQVIAAVLLGILIEKGISLFANHKTFGRAAVIVGTAAIVAYPLWQTVINNSATLQVNSRTTAQIWIDKNIPPGSRIAIERYSPYIDLNKFTVIPVDDFLPKQLQWYQEKNVQYLVFSEGTYARYYENPKRYAYQINVYESLFQELKPVKVFEDGGYEIKIYAMPTP